MIRELRRNLDDPPVEVTISILSGYAAYVPAEHFDGSGVIATVTTGICARLVGAGDRLAARGSAARRMVDPDVPVQRLLFVLIGFQLPRSSTASGQSRLFLAVTAAAVSGVVIVTRLVWVYATTG